LQVVGKAKPTIPPRTIESIIKSTDKRLKDPRAASPSRHDFRTLRHPNLDYHPDFIELKEKLEAYFEDRNLPIPRQKVLISKSHYWREVLFSSLLELLSELTFTEDAALQMQLLSKVKKWYEEKTTTIGALPQAIQPPRTPNPKIQFKHEILDEKPEFTKKDSLSKNIFKSSSPTKSKLPVVQPFKQDSRLEIKYFGEMKQFELTEDDLARTSLRFNEMRDREIRELRTLSVRNEYLKRFHFQRARFDENSAYKVEQTRVLTGSSYGRDRRESRPTTASDEMVFDFRSFTRPFKSPDPENLARVAEVRRMHSHMLGIDDSIDIDNTDYRSFNNSMTLYSAKPDFSFLQKTFRPVTSDPSSPFHSVRRRDTFSNSIERHHDLSDLIETKRKMSRFNMPFNIRTLEAGLMRPDDLPMEKLKFLPAGGSLLISNPLDMHTKGKKKKGRRSKSAKE